MAKDFFVTDVLRTAYCNNIVTKVDVSGPGQLRIYSGTIPTSADAVESSNVQVVITLKNPAFDPASAGVANLDVSPSPPSGTAGVSPGNPATHFRLYDGAGACVAQGIAGLAASTPDLVLSNENIAENDEITVQSLVVTVPRTLTEA